MSDDIAARLRHYANDCEIMCDDVLLHEAADEIERLRTEFSAVLGDAIAKDAENERLRAAGDVLEHSLLMWQSKYPHLDLGYDALDAWQEARRER